MREGTRLRVNGTIATAFGCPFEGDQPVHRVLWAAERYLEMGMHSITLADTSGMAHPRQVAQLCAAFGAAFPNVELTLHFHDTRGMGLANSLAGLLAGVTRFDASLGGLGGCPYAPGASGNICTEDLVHMCDSMGVRSGVDLDQLIVLARELPSVVGHEVPGRLVRAGRRDLLHDFPETV